MIRAPRVEPEAGRDLLVEAVPRRAREAGRLLERQRDAVDEPLVAHGAVAALARRGERRPGRDLGRRPLLRRVAEELRLRGAGELAHAHRDELDDLELDGERTAEAGARERRRGLAALGLHGQERGRLDALDGDPEDDLDLEHRQLGGLGRRPLHDPLAGRALRQGAARAEVLEERGDARARAHGGVALGRRVDGVDGRAHGRTRGAHAPHDSTVPHGIGPFR
jgi:hypothetical protein